MYLCSYFLSAVLLTRQLKLKPIVSHFSNAADNLKQLFLITWPVISKTNDGAPTHTAKIVQYWCEASLADFLPKSERTPSSPDQNPMDYSVWGFMMSKPKDYNCYRTVDQSKEVILKIDRDPGILKCSQNQKLTCCYINKATWFYIFVDFSKLWNRYFTHILCRRKNFVRSTHCLPSRNGPNQCILFENKLKGGF